MRGPLRSIYRCTRLRITSSRRLYSSSAKPSQFFEISEEVREALESKQPVVALESAVYTHGFPKPDNHDLALSMEETVRDNGAIPATVCVLDGKAIVGASPQQIRRFSEEAGGEYTRKVSRRDIPYLINLSLTGRREQYVGGTTVAGTAVLANMAGIKVFATGGIGGVHRGFSSTLDISADLTELGRTNIAVVSSGAKSFLDLKATLEYLETQGVYVGTFNVGQERPIELPAFWSVRSGINSPSIIEGPAEAARIIYASHKLGLTSGQLFANPIPAHEEIPLRKINPIINLVVSPARRRRMNIPSGADVTPYVLYEILKRTEGKSVEANRALLINNAAMGAKVAVELSNLESRGVTQPLLSEYEPVTASAPALERDGSMRPDVLIIGGLALDLTYDLISHPMPHTSNQAHLSTHLGGVATNVSLALHRSGIPIALHSVVGSDASGTFVLSSLSSAGLSSGSITISPSYSTATYVSLNDPKKDLYIAAADMRISETLDPLPVLSSSSANWVIFDGNLSTSAIRDIAVHCVEADKRAIFEPTSAPKAVRLFSTAQQPSIHAAAPNLIELSALYAAADARGLFSTDNPVWWRVLDALDLDSNFRGRLAQRIPSELGLAKEGVFQKAVSLLPFVKNLWIKLGKDGCLVVRLIEEDEACPVEEGARVVKRVKAGAEELGLKGVCVEYFHGEKVVEGIVSVNGAGDTFLGVLVAGIVRGDEIGMAVRRAQKAAIKTLGSPEAVGDIAGVWD